MAKVVMSPESEKDLVTIGDYIARHFKSPKSALDIIRKIKSRIDELKNFPLIGMPLSAIVATDSEYRILGCGSYLTFYRFADDTVFIDRILHGRQDYVSILLGDIQEESNNDF